MEGGGTFRTAGTAHPEAEADTVRFTAPATVPTLFAPANSFVVIDTPFQAEECTLACYGSSRSHWDPVSGPRPTQPGGTLLPPLSSLCLGGGGPQRQTFLSVTTGEKTGLRSCFVLDGPVKTVVGEAGGGRQREAGTRGTGDGGGGQGGRAGAVTDVTGVRRVARALTAPRPCASAGEAVEPPPRARPAGGVRGVRPLQERLVVSF